MRNKGKRLRVSDVTIALGAVLAIPTGLLIALVMLRGGNDNLTIEWYFLFVGAVIAFSGDAMKLVRRRK